MEIKLRNTVDISLIEYASLPFFCDYNIIGNSRMEIFSSLQITHLEVPHCSASKSPSASFHLSKCFRLTESLVRVYLN